MDFIGINVYKPGMYVVASDNAVGYLEAALNKSHPKMMSAWHVLDPVSLYWGPKLVQSLWNPKSIFVTENGCAAAGRSARRR